jgi:arylformamidase
MPVYKNDASRRPVLTFEKRVETDGMTSGKLEMDLHTGTHLDAPLHMVNGGDSIDEISLTSVVTSCRVIALMSVEAVVTPAVLMPFDIKAGEFILLKTHNSFDEGFNPEFVFLSEAAAKYLAEIGIKGIGMDGLGIERDQVGHPSHKALFNSGCVILEGLRLKHIEPGDYKLIALPLKIVGAEASPVRAILIEGM